MRKMNQIPTLSDLALQYGTITNEQFSRLNQLFDRKQRSNDPVPMDRLMLTLKLATSYQVGLLKLIQEYLIIKKSGEVFGKIAIEKGYAKKEDVDQALEQQKREFKQEKIKKLIGDILVESGVITIKQKIEVLEEQTFVDNQAEQILSENNEDNAETDAAALTDYEAKFLKIKVFDQEFAASLVEKKIATKREVKVAQKAQEESFEKDNQIRILGDIMVDLQFITKDQKNQILKEQKRLGSATIVGKEPIRVVISEDQMEAVVEIDEDAATVSLSELKTALRNKDIRHGVYSDAVLQCNLDMGNTQFIAARQDLSLELVKQKKAVYHFAGEPIASEEKKKGATLAEQYLGQEPHMKKNLFGQHVEQVHGWEHAFRCGAGTRLSKDKTKAFAGKTGFPSFSMENKLYIHPVINVLEDADLRYGPLEQYANLTVSGTLTGAYPVTAGNIVAREIRGARINAIGNVTSQVGITDAVIVAQGDIRARYLHNCRIETFGNIYVENEMIDCEIYCSGKVDSGNCHIIATTMYAKKGIEISGAGSGKTNACLIGAGTENHILERIRQLDLEIKKILVDLDELKEKKEEQDYFSKKTFQKMIELKIFHDRAKKKKDTLTEDFKKKKNLYKKEKLNNIVKLIHNFEKRKSASLASLKDLNEIKKKYDKEVQRLDEKISKLEPKIKKDTRDFKIDIVTFFNWTRKQENISKITINKRAFQGTIFKGIFSTMVLEKNEKNFTVFEKQMAENNYQLFLQKVP